MAFFEKVDEVYFAGYTFLCVRDYGRYESSVIK